MTKRHYNKGDVIQLTEGDCKDYTVSNPYLVLEPFDLKEMRDRFVAESDVMPNSYRFYKWLLDNLPVEKIEYSRIHLGEYDNIINRFEQ